MAVFFLFYLLFLTFVYLFSSFVQIYNCFFSFCLWLLLKVRFHCQAKLCKCWYVRIYTATVTGSCELIRKITAPVRLLVFLKIHENLMEIFNKQTLSVGRINSHWAYTKSIFIEKTRKSLEITFRQTSNSSLYITRSDTLQIYLCKVKIFKIATFISS